MASITTVARNATLPYLMSTICILYALLVLLVALLVTTITSLYWLIDWNLYLISVAHLVKYYFRWHYYIVIHLKIMFQTTPVRILVRSVILYQNPLYSYRTLYMYSHIAPIIIPIWSINPCQNPLYDQWAHQNPLYDQWTPCQLFGQ